MCSLIVLRGVCDAYPLLVAANRDERTDRKSSPPGVWHGRHRRVLSPRDREAGGTWLAVDGGGRFAGLTNVAAAPPVEGAPSRGHLPHIALDQDDLEAGIAAVLETVRETRHAAFQLVVADAQRAVVLRHVEGEVERVDWRAPALCLTNEHAAGAWSPPALQQGLTSARDVDAHLERLAGCLRDRGGPGAHAVCKHGADYATVSSSLVALPRDSQAPAIWRYAPGPPDVTSYRNYGNLFAMLRG